MPQLTDDRRAALSENLAYVRWVVFTRMSASFRGKMIRLLGSLDDLIQITACEFCRIVASLDELRTKPDGGFTLPPFVVAHLIAKVAEQANMRANARFPRGSFPEEYPQRADEPDYGPDERERVLALLAHLPERRRDAVRRRIMLGERWATIAADWGVTPQAMQQQVKLALDELRELWESA